MKGTIEIDKQGGVIECSFSDESSQIADCLTAIMQDINSYMKLNGNKHFQHATIKLDQHHVV
jgi:hypothetical protein